jgi:hypothetical protein
MNGLSHNESSEMILSLSVCVTDDSNVIEVDPALNGIIKPTALLIESDGARSAPVRTGNPA